MRRPWDWQVYRMILLAAVLVLGGATASAVTAGAARDALVYTHEVPIVELDPLAGYVNAPSPYEAGLLLYDNLVRFDESLNIIPALATSWRVSGDGRTWTFNLRQGVQFHDGTPFNAEAVQFNIRRSMDPVQNPLNRPLWDPIESVDVVDPYTVTITTRQPFPTLLNTLAHGSAGIVSPTAARRLGKELERQPVGSGPFKLKSFEPGIRLVLERNEEYWGPKPGVREITFLYVPEAAGRVGMLLSGQADAVAALTPQDAARLMADRRVRVIARPTLRTVGIGFNLLSPPLQDPRVRLALNLAVDKEAIVRAIFMGQAEVLDSPVAPNATGHAAVGPHPYDPDRARALLGEAGWRPGPSGTLQRDGQPLQLTLITPEGAYPNDIQVVQVVAGQLRNVGVDVRISRVDRAAYWDYLKVPAQDAQFDLFIWAFNPSNGDGGYALSSLFKSNPDDRGVPLVWNIGRYRNPAVDELLARSDVAVDPEERSAILAQVQRILMEENPYIWLYAERRIMAVRSDLTGIALLPTLFADFREVAR